jgi:amphi-Trp domain-containing protein
MASEGQEFAHESLQDRESIVKYLAALGEGLEKGQLTLMSNGERIALEAPALVKFDVQAKQRRSRSQLVLKLSWKTRKDTKELRVEPLLIDTSGPDE